MILDLNICLRLKKMPAAILYFILSLTNFLNLSRLGGKYWVLLRLQRGAGVLISFWGEGVERTTEN
jgi:hypothetical protein